MMTKRDVAAALNVHSRTVSKWVNEGLPVAVPAKPGHAAGYDLKAVRAWVTARDWARAEQQAESQAARVRKEYALAAEAEQRVEMRAAKLIAVEDVDRVWSAQVREIRRRLVGCIRPWSAKVTAAAVAGGPAAVERTLQAAVYGVLRELAKGELPADDQPAKPKSTRRRKSARIRKER